MVIAVAGRRVDPADTKQVRFPLKNVALVHERVGAMLRKEGATVVACSAACGADLVALGEARVLQLRKRVVLPFAEEKFRESSVVDRPGDWGPIYDEVLSEVKAAGDLVILKEMPEEEAYVAANTGILDEAGKIAGQNGDAVTAALIWNGESRGADDITEQFGNEARKRGWRVVEVSTL
jgi:hypothetical protein